MKNLNYKQAFSRYPEFWVLLILTLILFPLRQAIAGAGVIQLDQVGTPAELGPIFLASLGLVIFLIPGMALVIILGNGGDWWERLALAFVASIGSVGIIAQAAAIMHTSINFVLWAYLGLTVVLVVGALARLFLFPPRAEDRLQSDRPPLWMWAILIVMVLIVAAFSLNAPFDSDEIDATAYVQNIRNDPHIMLTEPKLNGDFAISVRYYFDTWLTDQALISRITGQDPLDQYKAIELALTLLTLASFYTFARRITNRRSAAVLATIVWALYLILSNHDSVAGHEVIVRPELDKVVAGFLVVPVGIGLLKTLFDHHRRRDWVWLVLASLAAMLTHPIAVGLFGLSIAGWGIAELITQHNRQTFWRLVLAGFILTMALAPDLVIVLPVGKKGPNAGSAAGLLSMTLDDTRDPGLAGELRSTFHNERLYILDNGEYLMSPRLVFQPFFLPAFLALPILFWQLRRSRGARILFGMLTVVPLSILFPPTAGVLGHLVSPWIFYRLHWPIGLASIVTVGWGLAWLYDRLLTGSLPRIKVSVPKYGLAAVGVGVWIIFMAVNAQYVQANLGYLNDLQMNQSQNCLWTDNLLRPLQQLAPDPAMVLGDLQVNLCLIGAAPYAGVMEFRTDATVRPFKRLGMEQEGWQRLYDLGYFMTTDVVDQRLLQIVDKWKIKFVVVETSRPLDGAMRHMPGMFQPLYTAEYRTVYRVLSTNQADYVVQANSLLTEQKFSDAAVAFEKLESADSPDTRYLAQIGLGYAYQQLGRVDDALTVWGQAAGSTKEGDPLALRAQVFGLRGQYDLAIQDYQQAIAREPDNLLWPVALGGQLYHTHRVDQAATTFEAAVAMDSTLNSASFHQRLGGIWLGLTEYDRAAEQFKQAIAITGSEDSYAALATTYIAARRVPEAEAVLSQMGNQDPWDPEVPLLRARVQALSGNWKSAASLTRQSLKLNPLVPNGNDSLASAITIQDGTRAALDQMKQLPGYRTLGFGDTLLSVAQLEAGVGQFDQANQDLAKAVIWDGTNSDYWQAQGDIQLALGNLDQAAATYLRVIQIADRSQAAYLRLSRIAHAEANIGQEQGYLIQATNALPADPSGELALGDFFLNQGQPDLAQRQYQVALDTQPDDPGVLTAIGDFHASRGEFDQALKYYQNALTRSPVASQAYLGMGSVYLSQGQLIEATDAITHAVRIAPGASAPHASLAALDNRQGNVDAALQELKQTIEQNPGFRSGYVSLAGQYLGQDNAAEAQNELQIFQERFPMFQEGYIGLGLLAEHRGDFAAAESSYRQALNQVSPTQSGSALLALGGLQSRQGKRDQAQQSFQTAIKQQPMLTSGYLALAGFWAHDGDYSKATSIVKQGLALSPGAGDLNAELGNLELAQGHVDQAEQIYDNYLKVFPGSLNVAIAKANLTAAIGHPDVALNQVIQLQQQWSGVPAVLSEQASLEATNGNPQAALDTAKKLTGLVPGDPQSWITLGHAASDLGQYQDAEGAFRRATTVQPGSASGWLALGEFLGMRAQMDSATSALNKSVLLDKAKTEPHIALADIEDREGKQTEAISEYKQAVSLDLGMDDALLALGHLSEQNGNLNDASEYLDKALVTSVTDPRAYSARSDLYLKQGQADQAVQILQKALNVISGNCQAYENLGDYLASLGEFDTAKSKLDQALTLPGCASSAHVSLGNVYRVQAKPTDAITEYNKAIAAQPGSALPYAALARTYANQNRQQDALATYVQGLSRSPASDSLTLANGAGLVRIGQVQQGMDLVLKGADLRPASATNLLALGRAYELVGQNANAETSYLGAAKLDASAPNPHLALGRLYLRMARFDQAQAEDNKAIQLAPGDATGFTQLGDYYQSRVRYDQAIAAYQNATSLDKKQAESLLALGQLYVKLGRFGDAERTFQQALVVRNSSTSSGSLSTLEEDATAPTSARAFVALGDLYLAQAQPQKAEAAFKSAVKVAPASDLGYLRLNQLYGSQNRRSDALAQVRQALAVVPTSASAYVALGEYQQSQSDRQGAEQSFSQAIAVAPINPDGYIHLGQLYQAQGRQQDALKQYLAATKSAPGSEQAFIALGDWQRLNAQWDSAEKSYQQAIALGPADPSGYLSLSSFYQSRGRNADALAQNQSAVQLAPASASALVALGNFQQSQLKWTEAEQAFKQAIEVNPTDPAGYVALSSLSVTRAKFADAEAQLKQVRAKVPGSVSAMLALARYYGERGELVAAQDQIQIAFGLQPGNLDVLTARAENLATQAKFEDADQAFKTAINLAPGQASPYIAQGDYESTRGNWESAVAEYKQVLAIEPTNEFAFLGLVRVDLEVNEKQDALKQAEEWVKVTPEGQISAISALGAVKRINGDFAGSAEAYQAAIDRLPGVMDSYVGLSQTQRAQAKFGDAIQLLDRAAALAPSNVSIYQSRALAQYAIGQPDAAAASYRQASEADLSSASAYVGLARDAMANEQQDQAIQLYQQAIAARPTEFAAYDDLTTIYNETKDLASALSTAQKAQQVMPSLLAARIKLAQAYAANQDQTAALNTLNQGLTLFPYDQGVVLTAMGDVYANFDVTSLALDTFHAAEARYGVEARYAGETHSPDLITPYLREADLYRTQLKDSQKALELYQKAASLDGMDPDPYIGMMRVYAGERLGRPTLRYSVDQCPNLPSLEGCNRAGLKRSDVHMGGLNLHNGLDSTLRQQYETRAADNPNSVEDQVALGVLYEAYHLYDESIATWQRVLQLDPANPNAFTFLSHDYALRETGRQSSASSMAQAMALGADDQEAVNRLVQLFNDRITSFPDGATFGSNVTIKGTANGSNTGSTHPFSYYKIEVGVGTDPKAWSSIVQSTTPVTDGVLGVWDISGLADGTYTLRLVVVDASGNYMPYDLRTIQLKRTGP